MRTDPIEAALAGISVVYVRQRRISRDAELELAKAVVEYFGPAPIDPMLTSDIAIRDLALAIVRLKEKPNV